MRTSNDGVGTEFYELVFKLLPEPLNILLLRFIHLFETLIKRRGHVVKVVMIQNSFVRATTSGVISKRKRRDGVPMERELPCDEVCALRLSSFLVILLRGA